MARPRKKDRHLPPCVYQRHGAYWYVKGGKWTRLGGNLREALEAYAGIACDPGGGMPALIDKVLGVIKGKVSPGTYRQYAGAAKHLKSRLAEFRPHEVQSRHVAAIKLDMDTTPNTANRCVSFLRVVFGYALEWQLVASNPCVGIRRFDENKRGRYISDAEFLAVYAKAGPRLQIIMDLLYMTGQRVSDVLRIRRADLKPEGIEFTPEKTRRKTGKKLIVQWTPALQAVVDRAKAMNGGIVSLTLLRNRKGKAPDYSSVALQWREACEAAGVEDFQMRDLRAKSLTDAERQGLNPTGLAAHASPAMTQRYIRRRQVPVLAGPSFGHVQNSVGQGDGDAS